MLVVDAANVIGSRPTGWWRDRAGAARRFVEQVRSAVADGRLEAPVTIVLEGQARAGAAESEIEGGVAVVHAAGSGDDAIAELAADSAGHGDGDRAGLVVVTADRGLSLRVETAGAQVRRPSWLLERLGI